MANQPTQQWQKSDPLVRGAIVALSGTFLARKPVIGVNGTLPWRYSEDLKRFKKRTINCAILMGRITWESIGQKELPERRNIVISRKPVAGVEHYNSVEKAIQACHDQDLWIIGGAQIYRAAMDYVNLLDITYVPDEISQEGSVKFPAIDLLQWRGGKVKKHPHDARLSYAIFQRAPAA